MQVVKGGIFISGISIVTEQIKDWQNCSSETFSCDVLSRSTIVFFFGATWTLLKHRDNEIRAWLEFKLVEFSDSVV